jgi:hypothetical protein
LRVGTPAQPASSSVRSAAVTSFVLIIVFPRQACAYCN